MPLQLPKANVKQVEGKATQDLTAHPWAGLKVRMILAARDQAGQTGSERALRIHSARAEFHQAAGQRRGRAAQEARARA